MGYRSTFVTEDNTLTLPQWFVDKWEEAVFIKDDRQLPIASKREYKCYGLWDELMPDLARVIQEAPDVGYNRSIYIIFFHEDGKYNTYTIWKNKIVDGIEEKL